MSVLGALLAAVASQMPASSSGAIPWRTLAAALGVVLLTAGTAISHRSLGAGRVRGWLRARAASEALKREAFRAAAGARPFDEPKTAAAKLDAARARIESALDDLLIHVPDVAGPPSAPVAPLTPAQYRASRVRAQIDGYYAPKAARYRKAGDRLRVWELVLALAAAIITALAGATGKTLPVSAVPFDIAALTAVATTVAGALTAHARGARFDELAMSYLATARRLEDVDAGFDAAATASAPWSAYVNRIEDAIAAETTSWMARWSRHW
jgi:hypothetical protein